MHSIRSLTVISKYVLVIYFPILIFIFIKLIHVSDSKLNGYRTYDKQHFMMKQFPLLEGTLFKYIIER